LFFAPTIFWFGYLLDNKTSFKKIILNITGMICIFFYQNIENKNYASAIQKTIKYQNYENKENLSVIRDLEPNKNILILGFFKAVPLYYQMHKKSNFIYRSANTQFITLFKAKGNNNLFYTIEDQNLFEDMVNGKPYYIFDLEKILLKINGSKSQNYINQKYCKIISSKQFKIFKLR